MFVIINDTQRGKGFGKGMLRLSLQYAFKALRVKKVTLGVFENNLAAYCCYKAAGFRDAAVAEPACYHVHGEAWKCLELEVMQGPSINMWGKNEET